MTGIPAYWASSKTAWWSKVRAMMPSTQRPRLRATSGTVSRTPNLPSRYTAWPPSWVMPASKVTRVRSEGFSNSIASVCPLANLRLGLVELASLEPGGDVQYQQEFVARQPLDAKDVSAAQARLFQHAREGRAAPRRGHALRRADRGGWRLFRRRAWFPSTAGRPLSGGR